MTQMLATFFELMQPSGVTGSFNQARRGFWACVTIICRLLAIRLLVLVASAAQWRSAQNAHLRHLHWRHWLLDLSTSYLGDAEVGREAYDLLYVIGFELLDREYRESNATYLTFPGVLSRSRDTFLEAVLSTPVRHVTPDFALSPPFSFRASVAARRMHVHADVRAFAAGSSWTVRNSTARRARPLLATHGRSH